MLIVSVSKRTIWVDILRPALIRFSCRSAGIATELPAKIRRRPIRDANEAEVRSVSSDLPGRDPDPQEPASASLAHHCRPSPRTLWCPRIRVMSFRRPTRNRLRNPSSCRSQPRIPWLLIKPSF